MTKTKQPINIPEGSLCSHEGCRFPAKVRHTYTGIPRFYCGVHNPEQRAAYKTRQSEQRRLLHEARLRLNAVAATLSDELLANGLTAQSRGGVVAAYLTIADDYNRCRMVTSDAWAQEILGVVLHERVKALGGEA